MDQNIHTSSLTCEVRIIQAKNIAIKPHGVVFVRCYLHAGSSSRVILDTKEIPSNSNSITWNQTFSLNCSGSQESINCLKQGTLVLELRRRSTAAPFIARIRGSRLIATAEISWKSVVEEVEKWVVMTPEKRVYDDVINPTEVVLQIAVKLQDCKRKRLVCQERWDESCGCNSCVDYEFFAIEAALEAL